MEIAGGEASLYNILTFVSLKMEIGWKRAPMTRKLRKSNPKKLPMPYGKFYTKYLTEPHYSFLHAYS